MKDGRTAQILIRTTPEVKRWLKESAREQGLSLSRMLAILVEGLKGEKRGKPRSSA